MENSVFRYEARITANLEDIERKLRSYLETEYLAATSDADAQTLGTQFPRQLVESIRDSSRPHEECQQLLAYVVGEWFRRHVDGEWALAPMVMDNPAIYFLLGLGITAGNGTIVNISETAKDILEGEDLDFTESMFNVNIRTAAKSSPKDQ
ncbi:hypothetical protein [Corynebacterium uterequi]|uniref:Uncharacterized protein n=1 Tax=Corynebacterium uterequi TaxID=1072256 RepID=A0A0G3HGX9_9CORY|nr:hypothetical protein [Corynebacterium uterequi]AKK12035.1 hypothetical protein CUTER_10355 [Corynebacterium uterequi]